jgi:hypothetical protein
MRCLSSREFCFVFCVSMGGVTTPVLSPTSGALDDQTPIEMRCETANTDIFYTVREFHFWRRRPKPESFSITDGFQVNGKKPEPYQKLGERFTLHYTMPITLSPGRRIIKAVAVLR